MAIDSYVFAARDYPLFYLAWVWEKLHRVFCRNSAFNGVTGKFYTILRRELFALCHLDHQLYNIDTGDHFAHRMLYLKPCVHLHKIEVFLLIGQKLKCSGIFVFDIFGCLNGCSVKFFSCLFIKKYCRRLLYQFLMSSL